MRCLANGLKVSIKIPVSQPPSFSDSGAEQREPFRMDFLQMIQHPWCFRGSGSRSSTPELC